MMKFIIFCCSFDLGWLPLGILITEEHAVVISLGYRLDFGYMPLDSLQCLVCVTDSLERNLYCMFRLFRLLLLLHDRSDSKPCNLLLVCQILFPTENKCSVDLSGGGV